MEHNEKEKTIDWKDDSGEIHTVVSKYHDKPEDGWQPLHGNEYKLRHQRNFYYVKGDQVGTEVHTDDYRAVIPAYIIASLVVIAICVIVTIFAPIVGIIFSVFGLVWLIGFWAKAPFTKWKNQKKTPDEEKNQ